MDTGKKYIKMCEQAKEIQEIGKEPKYDQKVIYDKETEETDFLWWYGNKGQIWLPRQDELQEIVDLSLWQLNFKFDEWFYDIDGDGNCDFHIRHEHLNSHSMEQLWLAFIMHEKYKKHWDEKKEEWVTNE